MTREEYADYAITFLHLRGGPEPQIVNKWRIAGTPAYWGVRHKSKRNSQYPHWDQLTPAYGQRCLSRREAALRYCWKHGLIRRPKKYPWTEADLQNLRDPE